MVDLKSWQRNAGKIQLKEGERAFVYTDGTIVASDTNNKAFQAYMKEKQKERFERKSKEKEPLRNKIKELRELRDTLKKVASKGESAAKKEYKRLNTKKEKLQKLQAEVAALEGKK